MRLIVSYRRGDIRHRLTRYQPLLEVDSQLRLGNIAKVETWRSPIAHKSVSAIEDVYLAANGNYAAIAIEIALPRPIANPEEVLGKQSAAARPIIMPHEW